MAGLIPDPDARGELFSAYFDGQLAPREVAVVSDLLDGDELTIAEFRSLQSVRRSIRLLPQLEVPANLLPDGHLGDRLSAYLDGELVTLEHRRVTRHVVECPDCRVELQELDRARIAIRSLPGVDTTATGEIPVTPAAGHCCSVGPSGIVTSRHSRSTIWVLATSLGHRRNRGLRSCPKASRCRSRDRPAFAHGWRFDSGLRGGGGRPGPGG